MKTVGKRGCCAEETAQAEAPKYACCALRHVPPAPAKRGVPSSPGAGPAPPH